MSDVYRDPLAGLRAKIQLLKAEINTLEQAFTEELWIFLPADMSRRLQEGKGRCIASPDETHEALNLAILALAEYLNTLKEVHSLVPQLEQGLTSLPHAVPDIPVKVPDLYYPITMSGHSFAPLRRLLIGFDSQLKIDLPTDLENPRAAVFFAHLTIEDTPFTLHCYRGISEEAVGQGLHFTLATSVAKALPTLRLRPEGYRHSLLLKPLGLVKDLELGQESFDNTFIIEAEPWVARTLLTDEVRHGLLVLSRYDIPRLEVNQGAASLSWTYEPDHKVILSAIKTLQGIRSCTAQIQLLKA